MDATQILFYGFGQVIYAIAMADGKIQPEEEEKFKSIVEDKLSQISADADYAEIIFQLLEHDRMSADWLYEEGIKNMKLGRIKLTPELKQKFIETAEAIAEAFPPKSKEENKIIQDFQKAIAKW